MKNKSKYIIELDKGMFWLADSVHCDFTVHFDRATTWDNKEQCQEWCDFIHERNLRGYDPRVREITISLVED